MLPRVTCAKKILTIHFIRCPFLIHLTLDLQNLPKGVEHPPFLLENRASLKQKQLPKSKYRYCLMMENKLHCLNLR